MKETQSKTFLPENKDHWLELRSQDITSTEVSALFGLSPYMTEFEVWHRHKSNLKSDFKENDRTIWGSRLEPAIAKGIAEDNGWDVIPKKEYMRREDLRAGSSFDYAVVKLMRDEQNKLTGMFSEEAILEIKNVDSLIFKENWIVDEETKDVVEAPTHIEMQVQHQLMISGLDKAYIGALVGGNKLTLIERNRDEEIIAAIESKIKEFWKSIEENREPKPDFKKDADFISKLHGFSEPGTENLADEKVEELAKIYKEVAEQEKEITSRKKAIKAEILTRIGNTERVLGESFTISAGMVGPAHIEYDREGYRNFRITFRKKKEQ